MDREGSHMAEKKRPYWIWSPGWPSGPLSFHGLNKAGSLTPSEPGEKPEPRERRTLTAQP